jgi:hypothetical protein
MADAPDSKSGRGNPVRVQVPPPAPKKTNSLHECAYHSILFLILKLSVYSPRFHFPLSSLAT